MFPELEISLPDNQKPDANDPRYKALVNRIAEMLAREPEALFSMLYRLDIDEQKLKNAISPKNGTPADEGIAILVIQRQLMRQKTKEIYRSKHGNEIME